MSKENRPTTTQCNKKKGSVLRLHDIGEAAEGCTPSQTDNQRNDGKVHRRTKSDPISMTTIGNLLDSLSHTSEEEIFGSPRFGRSLSYKSSSGWVGIEGSIQGNDFILRVRNQQNARGSQTRYCSVRVRQEDPTPCMTEFDSNLLHKLELEDPAVNPMFHIEIESSGEISPSSNGLNLQFNFNRDLDHNMNYVILQQESGSNQWKDITDECTTKQGSPNIQIPVKKSSKIWVIRLRKSLASIKHTLCALIHGQVLFHILIYYFKMPGKVKVRIIGISDKLYQNRKGLRTAVEVAKELKFVEAEELPAKQLVKKGFVKVEVHQENECVSHKEFDIGGSTLNKNAEWHDYVFDSNDMKDNLKVKVIIDQEGIEEWPIIDLNEILCDKDEEERVISITKPSGFEGEVCEVDLEWLAQHLNNDVDKVARHLKVDHNEIETIRRGSDSKETQDIRILRCWITTTRKSGKIPTWETLKDVLEHDDVRRFDVIRARLKEEEIDDKVCLWLEPRVTAFCRVYGRVLDVPDYEMQMICRNFEGQSEAAKCTAILKRWKERTRTPTIEALIQGLESDILNKNELAKEMREKFLKDNSGLS